MKRSIESDRLNRGTATANGMKGEKESYENRWRKRAGVTRAQNLLAFQTNFMHINWKEEENRSKNSIAGCLGRI